MKIAVVGNLGNLGYSFTKALRKIGQNADLFITYKNGLIADSQNPWISNDDLSKNIPWIKKIRTDNIFTIFSDCVLKLSQYDTVIAITTSPAYCQFFSKKLVSICTGSDIRDYVWQKGIKSWLLKQAYKKSYHVFVPFSEMHWAPKKLNIEKKSSPIYVTMDIQAFDTIKQEKENDKLTIFCPTNWIINRHDSKGINKLLNAIIKLLEQGYDFDIIMIDHSQNDSIPEQDKNYIMEITKKFPNNIKIIKRIERKKDLIREYKKCDLIADQFSIGMFGLIGMEALCSRKPLMAYFNKESDKFYNGETPPILNCQNEEEIFEILKMILDGKISRNELSSLGEKGYNWILKWHSEEKVARSIIEKIQ